MNSKELQRKLKKAGCTFEAHRGGSGHLTITNPANGKKSQLPMHGAGKELGTGLVRAIYKQLEIKQ